MEREAVAGRRKAREEDEANAADAPTKLAKKRVKAVFMVAVATGRENPVDMRRDMS